MPQISVIIPVYNVELYLKRCIDSVLAQTFHDYELILVDDGSRDQSGAICDEYAKKDSRIQVIHQNNSGVSIARNVGLARANGEYITFVDSDDWVDPDYLSLLYELAVEYKAEITCCTLNYEGNSNRRNEFADRPVDLGCKKIFSVDSKDFCFGQWYTFVGAACKLIKRTLIEENGLNYDQNFTNGEDAVFFVEAMCVANCCVATAKPLYHYYMRPDSASHSAKLPQLFSDLRAWYKICNRLNSNWVSYHDAVNLLLWKLFNIITYFCNNDLEMDKKEKKYIQNLFSYAKKHRHSHGRGIKFEILYILLEHNITLYCKIMAQKRS